MGKPLKIDLEKSTSWALASLGSVGVGPVGVQLFDLVNRITHRAHRVELDAAGVSLGPPISGSYGASDYVNFQTPRPVNFEDFNGLWMTVRETNVALYSWATVSFWSMSVRISGGGLNIPGLSVSSGNAKVLYSNGRPLGDVDLEVTLPPTTVEPGPFKNFAPDDAQVYRIPGDVLFGFNKHHLTPGSRTEQSLTSLGFSLHKVPDFSFLVVGHTDSIGSPDYNIKLSKRRAETVANWFIQRNLLQPAWLKTVAAGESEPIATNATAEGRAQNRRVEVVAIRDKFWKSYR